MAILKVSVKNLNKRKYPVQDFSLRENILGTVSQGHMFEAVIASSNCLGNWFVDREGVYYWEGGVTIISDDNTNEIFI